MLAGSCFVEKFTSVRKELKIVFNLIEFMNERDTDNSISRAVLIAGMEDFKVQLEWLHTRYVNHALI